MVKLYHIMSTIAYVRSITMGTWLLLASPFFLYAIVHIYFVRYYKPKSTLFRTLPPKLKPLDRESLDASPRSKGAPEKIRLACSQVCRFPVGAASHTFVRALRGWAQARVDDTQGTGPASGDRAATSKALDLLEKVVNTARACPGHWKPKKVHQSFVMHQETLRAQVVEYTARECLWIICNALLGNIREDPAASLKPDYKRNKGLKLDALLFDPMDIVNASTHRQSRLDDALIATEKVGHSSSHADPSLPLASLLVSFLLFSHACLFVSVRVSRSFMCSCVHVSGLIRGHTFGRNEWIYIISVRCYGALLSSCAY